MAFKEAHNAVSLWNNDYPMGTRVTIVKGGVEAQDSTRARAAVDATGQAVVWLSRQGCVPLDQVRPSFKRR